MNHLEYRLLSAIALVVVSCACGAVDLQPESAFPGRISGTVSAGAGVEHPHGMQPADRTASAGTGTEPSHPFAPADPRLHLNVHVYGFSYHADRQGVRRAGLDNEFNLGFGLNYAFHEDARSVGFLEAGFYRDSGSELAKLAGAGYQLKFGEHWRIGGALVGAISPTYNRGRFFIAPLPIVTYDFGIVKVNAIYMPRYGEYNKFAVFGFYFSLPLKN